jgi:CelD/BcsL family acetyltransferase involved in cellulose biosynthesis
MSDTTDAVLEQLRTTLRELELDHVQLAGRILQIQHDIALVENGPRRRPGRPRRPTVLEMPDRVAGAQHEPETQENAA